MHCNETDEHVNLLSDVNLMRFYKGFASQDELFLYVIIREISSVSHYHLISCLLQ